MIQACINKNYHKTRRVLLSICVVTSTSVEINRRWSLWMTNCIPRKSSFVLTYPFISFDLLVKSTPGLLVRNSENWSKNIGVLQCLLLKIHNWFTPNTLLHYLIISVKGTHIVIPYIQIQLYRVINRFFSLQWCHMRMRIIASETPATRLISLDKRMQNPVSLVLFFL